MNKNNTTDLENMIEQFISFKNQSGQLAKENDKNSYRRAIEKGWRYFKMGEYQFAGISKNELMDFRRYLIGKENMSEGAAGSYASRFTVFYKWLLDKKQISFLNEENEEGERKIEMTNTQDKQTKRKVNFNLDFIKFVKLSALALRDPKGKTTLTDLISAAIDDFLEKHKAELDDIKKNGLF